MICSECGHLMIDIAFYDPDGTKGLKWVEHDNRYWACINKDCKIGKQNRPDNESDTV